VIATAERRGQFGTVIEYELVPMAELRPRNITTTTGGT
jgi:hypothetical protein